MQLKNKRIIVTGSASGIGAGTVLAFVREGAIVSALDIADEAGGKLAAEASSLGPGSARFYSCDIASPEQVTRVFEQAGRDMGGGWTYWPMSPRLRAPSEQRTSPSTICDPHGT